MLTILMMLGLAVAISIMSSTPEGREKARKRLEPLNRALILPTLILWALLLLT